MEQFCATVIQTLHGSILSLHASIDSAHGPPWLHYEPFVTPDPPFDFVSNLDPDPPLNFDADLDPAFHCYADPDPASLNCADPDGSSKTARGRRGNGPQIGQ